MTRRIVFGIPKVYFIYLRSLGKAFASTAVPMVRELVFGVGFALLPPQFFGQNGVLYSMSVSDLLTFAIFGSVIAYTCRTLDKDTTPCHSEKLPEPVKEIS